MACKKCLAAITTYETLLCVVNELHSDLTLSEDGKDKEVGLLRFSTLCHDSHFKLLLYVMYAVEGLVVGYTSARKCFSTTACFIRITISTSIHKMKSMISLFTNTQTSQNTNIEAILSLLYSVLWQLSRILNDCHLHNIVL